jgi:energy-coupling factor transport system substrate-specific component
MSASPVAPAKSNWMGWSTRDLLITFAIALAFAVVLVPITYLYVATLPLGLLARAAVGGFYFLPAAFVAYVMRKPGAVLLVSIASGLAAMFFTPYGFVVLMVSLITGLLGEVAVWLITRYRHFSRGRLLFAGALAGLLEYGLILVALRASDFVWWVGVLAAALSALTFAVCALLARLLADAVVKTGVLANTQLGQSVIDEV